MSLSEFEIKKITEIVAGKVGASIDAKEMRRIIDAVVDNLENANKDIKGVTCEVSANKKVGQEPSDTTTQGSGMPEPNKPKIDSDLPEAEGGLYSQIKQTDKSRVIIAAFGKNRPGVVAAITQVLAELNCSIEDISQTLMQEFFSMIMIVDIKESSIDFASLREKIQSTEAVLGMKVYVMHEDIFRYMHRI